MSDKTTTELVVRALEVFDPEALLDFMEQFVQAVRQPIDDFAAYLHSIDAEAE